MIQERTLFQINAYSKIIDWDNAKLAKHILEVRKSSKGRTISNAGGWQSEDIKTMEPDHFLYDLLTTEILPEVVEIYKLNSFDTNSVRLDNYWYNVNGYKDFNVEHSHTGGGCYFSAVYYVKTPENCGDIVFSNPNKLALEYLPFTKSAYKENPRAFRSYYFNPEPGLLVIFPSYLGHYVEPNMSQEERISIAFNFTE